MPEVTIESLLSGLIGAVIGALLTVALTAWLSWRKEIRNVSIEKEVLKIKREFLDDLKDNIKDAEKAATTARNTHERVQEDAERIYRVRDQAETIVRDLRGKTEIDPEAVAAILRREIQDSLQALRPRFQMGHATLNGQLEKRTNEETAERATPIKFPPGVFHENPEVYVSLNRGYAASRRRSMAGRV